jgi:hypothetical protein
VEELCAAASAEVAAGEGVRIANYLCPGNYAVSGGVAGCDAVERMAKDFKARMTVRLAVAGEPRNAQWAAFCHAAVSCRGAGRLQDMHMCCGLAFVQEVRFHDCGPLLVSCSHY